MKDSIGNEIPALNEVSIPNRPHAPGVNFTFQLACRLALSKGHKVIYNADTKTANITDENGLTSTVSHV